MGRARSTRRSGTYRPSARFTPILSVISASSSLPGRIGCPTLPHANLVRGLALAANEVSLELPVGDLLLGLLDLPAPGRRVVADELLAEVLVRHRALLERRDRLVEAARQTLELGVRIGVTGRRG